MTSSLAGMALTLQAPRKHLSSQPFLALGCLPASLSRHAHCSVRDAKHATPQNSLSSPD